jgi:hypothetical protein
MAPTCLAQHGCSRVTKLDQQPKGRGEGVLLAAYVAPLRILCPGQELARETIRRQLEA